MLKDSYEQKTPKSNHDAHALGHIIKEKIVTKLGVMIEYSEVGDMFIDQIVLPNPT